MNTTGKLFVEIPGPDVFQMDHHYFPNPWSLEQWQNTDPSQSKLFTWREGQLLVGYALFGTAPYDDTAHLFKILVDPAKRGSQTSAPFWSAILSELRNLDFKSIYLEVESSNGRAIKFYEKCGFKLLRKNKAYYSNGEDAFIMSLTL
jgi:ribosomal protein S18 acetylase RimI-like enzyme